MKILVVDDDIICCEDISRFLENSLGHNVTQCHDGREALDIFSKEPHSMVLTDIFMPGMTGIELLEKIKGLPDGEGTDVVLITGHASVSSAISALRAGAYDYLQKPVNLDELSSLVERVVEHQMLKEEYYELTNCFKERIAEATHETELKLRQIQQAYAKVVGIGNIGIFSQKMRELISLAERLHHNRGVPVLIEGETGTGKEILARMIHYGSGDVTTPFVSINCSAISQNLFESELFGYESGAFTGGKRKGSMGKLELANGGTLFLDEIGELPMEFQPKLLRVLQEKEIFRVGGLKKIKLDVRIVCATNKDLLKMVEQGEFRRDLYYRLNMGKITIPPLRERKEAIIPLANMFLGNAAEQKKSRCRSIGEEARAILEEYPWPGNVRELQNTIERIILFYDDQEIKREHLFFLTSDGGGEESQDVLAQPLDKIVLSLPRHGLDLKNIEGEIVRKVLHKFDNNKTHAAAYLGLSRSSLRRKLDRSRN